MYRGRGAGVQGDGGNPDSHEPCPGHSQASVASAERGAHMRAGVILRLERPWAGIARAKSRFRTIDRRCLGQKPPHAQPRLTGKVSRHPGPKDRKWTQN